MLKGIAASAGVSVAKVYKLETPKVVIEKKAGVAEEEVKKFEDALEKTKKDIEGVKERAAKRLSEEELADQGIKQNTVRLSIGTENIDDLIDALDTAFASIQ